MNDLTHSYAPVVVQHVTRLPKPREIRAAVMMAIIRDMRDDKTPMVPVHIFSVVDAAISEECDRVTAESLVAS